ncbi:multidrug resistance-associated protein 1-like isoform X5 [Apostichopus japonicus]|uniref:multidrug resistance-associated protein 1-like isoform X5 n=1 Tax=Stichopus japonicus TaxID=307972 RepID=UPI003AB4F88D
MEGFCGSPFWNASLLDQSLPDTSPCFQETLLSWAPAAYLWILAPFYSHYLKGHNAGFIKVSRLHRAKTLIGFLLMLPPMLDVLFGITQLINTEGELPLVYVVTPAITTLTMVLAFSLVQLERLRGVRSSAAMFLFWVLNICCSLFEFWSKCINAPDMGGNHLFRYITFFIFFVLLIIAVILSAFVDDKPFYSPVVEGVNECPEETASFVSRLTFWWFTSLISLGYKKPLETTDLWTLRDRDKASTVVPNFRKHWRAEKRKAAASYHKKPNADDSHPGVLMVNLEEDANGAVKRKHEIYKGDDDPETSSIGEVLLEQTENSQESQKNVSFVKALVKTFGPMFLVGSFLKLIFDVMVFIQPLILRRLIQYTEDKTVPAWEGYFFAGALFVVAIFQTLILQRYFHIGTLTGMHVRTALLGSIYRKAIHLSNSARKSSTIGEVVNLMSVDAQKLMDLCLNLNLVWSSPLQICITLYLLIGILGVLSVFAGIFVMVLMIPLNMWVARKTRALQVQQMGFKDSRVKLMGEILSGIKVLKLYAWERSFQEKVLKLRRDELKVLRRAAYYNAVTSFAFTCAPFLVTLSSFAVFLLSDENNVLNAETIFVSLSLFNLLRFPLAMLPFVVFSVVQAHVSLKRLSRFLKLEELNPQNVDHFNMPGQAITVEDGKFSWSKEDEPVLHDISLDVPQGALVAVVGQVGTGKSSLLSALLGEMEKKDGKVFVQGSVAYVAQQAWIQNETVRGNVLFGKDLNSTKYEKILQACALQRDLEVLPGGDLTEIGEKGINLSGGQKQRVSLARAVYANCDIYLLDDPLSAVDAHVGKHIFDNVVGPNGVLKKKTRIFVTHGISFLPQVDKIVVLKNGAISEEGSYNELLERNGAFAEFLQNYSLQEEEEKEVTEADAVSMMSSGTKSQAESLREIHQNGKFGKKEDGDVDLTKEGKSLIDQEKAEIGKVAYTVYFTYLKSVGLWLSLLILSFFILYDIFSVGSNIWLSVWSEEPLQNGTLAVPIRNKYLAVYGLFGLGQVLAGVSQSVLLYLGALRASGQLHNFLLQQILRCPMSFFDITPAGRILNRFSKDMQGLDEEVANCLQDWFLCVLEAAGVIFIVTYSTRVAIVALVPLCCIYIVIQRYFVSTSRQLKRLESVSRSPIYSHFSETLSGTSTIRAFSKQKDFILQNEQLVDRNQETYYPNIVSNRWLAIRLEFIGNGIVFFAALFATIGREYLSAGLVGLSVAYAMQVTQTLNWMVRMTSELETNIVAVERIKEYTEIETEAAMDIPEKKPDDSWPPAGEVCVKDYSTRYREGLDLVLKGISFTIQPGEKVGIVGRTGAGKSSLTLGLFRIIEAAGGSITIDGQDISEIGLYDLRSKLTIIPQDPVLFAGDLRMNLDPFESYSDDQIWDALRHSHLDEFVSSLSEGLMHKCTEGGENLSVGQRQLICLARALLRKTKILILDEATAAVDLETDDLIQATIRTEFVDCTILTIAHRLNTIMDNTRVLVLDSGEIAEYDTPAKLLETGGIFYGMAKDAGLVAS